MIPDRSAISAYLAILSGSAGRLVLGLVYFLIVANALPLGDFGIFAAASAAGVVASRLLGFGFVSPLFRAATLRPRLIGTYLAGFAGLAVLSLPVLAAAGWGLHAVLFSGRAPALPVAMILLAEMLPWRLVEVVAIANNGLRRYARASSLVILGSALRSLAAVGFWLWGSRALEDWALAYLACTGLTMVLALAFWLPEGRWRWAPRLYARRMHDAWTAMVADLAFYLQAELDKFVVLGFAGARAAGLYAIAMRVIDLTALPIRSFNQMAIQRVMGARGLTDGPVRLALVEAGIALVSVAGLAAVAVLLHLAPGALGRNVAEAAPLLIAMLLVPAFRNLIEYHAELLYARERTVARILLMALVAGLKALLMLAAIAATAGIEGWAPLLNAVFALCYLVSAVVTYRLAGGRQGMPR